MASAVEPQPQDSVRLFVGNLVPSITDVALLRLFSRFGDASEFERDNQQGFAHLSIKPKPPNQSNHIERCISSLNRTTWCSTTLRVERAREHFLARLKREWAEQQNQGCLAVEVVQDPRSGDHFANFKKGTHTCFSFPDLEPSEFILENQEDDHPDALNPINLKCSSANESESDAKEIPAEVAVDPVSSKSVKLDSTLALFGLSSTSVEREPSITEIVREKKRHQPPRERSPAKRSRSPIRTEENAEEMSQNPSLFDINAEKRTANMVLQKLFPEPQITPFGSTAHRRLGLYRKLSQATNDDSNRDEVGARKEGQARVHDMQLSRPSAAVKGDNLVVSFRRAGLHSMLVTQASSK